MAPARGLRTQLDQERRAVVGLPERARQSLAGVTQALCEEDLGTGNGEVDRSTLFHARSDDVVPLAVKLFALDLQFSQFLL